MRKHSFGWLVMVLLVVASLPAAYGQRGPGWGNGSGGGRLYNPRTVVTVSGEVTAVERIASPRGRAATGDHVVLKTTNGSRTVHMGPTWYMDRQTMKIAPKDQIAVTGSQITLGGKSVIIAREVKKDGQTLRLRDESGMPLWAGRGGRAGRGMGGRMGGSPQ